MVDLQVVSFKLIKFSLFFSGRQATEKSEPFCKREYPISDPATFPTRHHLQNQLHHHNGQNQLKLLRTIYITHFCFDLACSCIMARLATVATSPNSRRPLPIATLIFMQFLRYLPCTLLLGQNILCIFCSQCTSLTDISFFGPLAFAKGFISFLKVVLLCCKKGYLVSQTFYPFR